MFKINRIRQFEIGLFVDYAMTGKVGYIQGTMHICVADVDQRAPANFLNLYTFGERMKNCLTAKLRPQPNKLRIQ